MLSYWSSRAGALLCAFSSIAFLQAGETTLDLGPAQDFNLLVWGNGVLPSGDSEGRMAVGGDLQFNAYSVGATTYFQQGTPLQLTDPLTGALIVGGTLTWSGGVVEQGSVYVGGLVNGPTTYDLNVRAGSVTQSGMGTALPFDFAFAQAQLTARSASYGSLSTSGTALLQDSTLRLTGAEASLNVFSLNVADWSTFSSLELLVPEGAYSLINVFGTSVSIGGKMFQGDFTQQDHVLFNFVDATSLTLAGVGFEGSILAPLAAVDFQSGGLNGQLIAASYQGSGELHNFPFASTPSGLVAVPEPSTYALAGALSLGVFAWLRRRRK